MLTVNVITTFVVNLLFSLSLKRIYFCHHPDVLKISPQDLHYPAITNCNVNTFSRTLALASVLSRSLAHPELATSCFEYLAGKSDIFLVLVGRVLFMVEVTNQATSLAPLYVTTVW